MHALAQSVPKIIPVPVFRSNRRLNRQQSVEIRRRNYLDVLLLSIVLIENERVHVRHCFAVDEVIILVNYTHVNKTAARVTEHSACNRTFTAMARQATWLSRN